MQISSQQLERQLQRGIYPVYLIQGDEPLLFEEAASLIIAHAKQQDFEERRIFHCEQTSSWDDVFNETAMLSLFDEKKVIDIRLRQKSPDATGKKALERILKSPRDDQILLLRAPLLTKSNQKQAWFKSLDKLGCIVTVWPIKSHQLLPWVKQRMQAAGLSTTPEGYQFISDCVEGNLLAAHQEIQKLGLLFEPGSLSLEQCQQALSQLARYDIFQLCDTALKGNSAKVNSILTSLEQEKTEPTLVLWALCQDIRTLARLQWLCTRGAAFAKASSECNVWEKRKPLFKHALDIAQTNAFYRLLEKARRIDGIIKGLYPGNAWCELQRLALSISSQNPGFIDA